MNRYILLALVFVLGCSPVFAQDVIDADWRESRAEELLQKKKEVDLTTKEREDLRKQGWMTRREGTKFPFVTELHKPADYKSEYDRGTVEYQESQTNYSLHSVVIPNGTTVIDKNLAQTEPGSDVIVRDAENGHNLTFIDCNLVNVKFYPDWTETDCNTAQIWRVPFDADGDGKNFAYKSQFVASHSDDIPEVIVAPKGALRR